MLFRFGRFLQLLGLFVAPIGVAGNVLKPDEVTIKVTLLIACVGMVLFGTGWMLQQRGRP